MSKKKKKSHKNATSKYSEQEWEKVWAKKNMKWTKQKRRQYLKYLAETIGLFNVNKKDLAERFNCDRKTLYRDIDAIYKEGIDPDTVKHTIVDYSGANAIMLKGLAQEFIKSSGKDKASIARALAKLQETHTNMLERYGLKEVTTPLTDTSITVHIGKDPTEESEEDE